jgi:hypothetical protein
MISASRSLVLSPVNPVKTSLSCIWVSRHPDLGPVEIASQVPVIRDPVFSGRLTYNLLQCNMLIPCRYNNKIPIFLDGRWTDNVLLILKRHDEA